MDFARRGTVVLLDDAARSEEQTALQGWQDSFGDAVEIMHLPNFTRGLAAVIVLRAIHISEFREYPLHLAWPQVKKGLVPTESPLVASVDQTLALNEESAERQLTVDSLSAQLSESQNKVTALTTQVAELDAELKRMKRTQGWRWLSYYGKIKYRFLLPIHRRLSSYLKAALRFWRGFRLFSFDFLPLEGRAKQLYTALGDFSFCDQALYLNYGYWKNAPKNLDEAGCALADLLAKTVKLGPGDEVLDVGFGFGDQDFFWHNTYRPAKIAGINVTPAQVRVARERAAQRGLSDSITFAEGDATRLPFPDAHFTVVFALECAFHFKTREAFFREALRVLKPGGRI